MSLLWERRRAALAFMLVACSLAPIDYVGKQCPTGQCPESLVCVAQQCVRAAGFDGSVDAGDAGDAGPQDAATPDAGVSDAGPRGDGGLHFVSLTVAADVDDATWDTTDEQVTSVDGTMDLSQSTSMAARFRLPIAPGSVLVDVRYQVERKTGTMADGVTATVRTWNSISVPPFDNAHVHPVELHDPAGFRPESATFNVLWHPNASSDDLSALLQPLVNRPDWVADSVVGIVITPAAGTTTWAGFADFNGGTGLLSRLDVQWRD